MCSITSLVNIWNELATMMPHLRDITGKYDNKYETSPLVGMIDKTKE